ncbi:CPA1 family monovalent cation:H+ antiporter [Pedobacter sp. UYP30]|uniref:cation:proton antiporter n=1 Tax=Pedobacter sp. UYP30 TaxID=1756400 RepID=UPI0033941C3C
MSTQEIIAITIVLAALFAYINHRFIKWPPTIGIMAISLICSVLLVTLGNGKSLVSEKAVQLALSVDFQDVLMNFMLSFLLFAGAIHIDSAKLKKESVPVIVLATVGILISTFLVGGILWQILVWFSIPIPFIYCLIFGSLISPTDPIAVMGILKRSKIPESLELKIAGESLFNDGIAVVIFVSLVQIARSSSGTFHLADVGILFLEEAMGGLVFGAILGYIGYYALKSIDDYNVEVLITLAIVMGGYFIAGRLHVSGPLAMVVAGLITGNKSKRDGMSDITRDYLGKFWKMIDEILNAVLFLFIGLEMLIIKTNITVFLIGLICILVVLFSRWISVLIPIFLLRFKVKFEKNVVSILTWGGLRGGISVALALSLGPDMYRDQFVLITYIIVVFSILVQGLTIGALAKKLKY